MTVYKGFNLNDPSTAAPWGTREQQSLEDIIDTAVGDSIQGAKDSAGHKHAKLYFTGGTEAIQAGTATLGIGRAPGTNMVEIQGDVNIPAGSKYKINNVDLAVQGATGLLGVTGMQGPAGPGTAFLQMTPHSVTMPDTTDVYYYDVAIGAHTYLQVNNMDHTGSRDMCTINAVTGNVLIIQNVGIFDFNFMEFPGCGGPQEWLIPASPVYKVYQFLCIDGATNHWALLTQAA